MCTLLQHVRTLNVVDCVFVLDNSVSIQNDKNFGLIRNLIVQIVEQLSISPDKTLVSILIPYITNCLRWKSFPNFTDQLVTAKLLQ